MIFRRQHLSAPQESGGSLIVPSGDELEATIRDNRRSISTHTSTLFGQSIAVVRAAARQDLQRAAIDYTQQYRTVQSPWNHLIQSNNRVDEFDENQRPSMILSGHQPELFHAGVWFKNFVLSKIATGPGRVGINLIIDNDLCGIPKISVLRGDVKQPKLKSIAYDRSGQNVPYESRTIIDRDLFASFGQRVADSIKPFVESPLIEQLWPHVLRAAEQTPLIGTALAQGRHLLEEQFGLNTLEIPLSQVCSTLWFSTFVAEIVSRIDEFQAAYNETLLEYKRLNRIKSAARPVPKLSSVEGYLETPFWIWSREQPIRLPLYTRSSAGMVELTDFKQIRIRCSTGDLNITIHETQSQLSIRPRALTTTLYARHVLSDLFIHGIGGALYDELTDQISMRFFKTELPRHVTATATMKLPLNGETVTPVQITRYRQQLRELDFRPEDFIDDPDTQQAAWIRRKFDLIQSQPQNGSRKAWHDEIVAINNCLSNTLRDQKSMVRSHLERSQQLLERSNLLNRREFSYCLFPPSLPDQLLSE